MKHHSFGVYFCPIRGIKNIGKRMIGVTDSDTRNTCPNMAAILLAAFL